MGAFGSPENLNYIKAKRSCWNCGTEFEGNFCPYCGSPARSTKKSVSMIGAIIPVAIFIIAFIALISPKIPAQKEITLNSYSLQDGGTFKPGAYINVAEVQILYNGNFSFTAINRSKHTFMIMPIIVGVKKNGTYEPIQYLNFGGADNQQYDKDKSENGWAVTKWTNRIKPSDSLTAKVTIMDFGGNFPKPDIDGDGYYDVVFNLIVADDNVISSDKIIKSVVYKLSVYG